MLTGPLAATSHAPALPGPSFDAGSLHASTIGRVPLPEHGLELVIADSRIPGAGRGLFACTTTADAPLLPAGTPLCGLAVGTWREEAKGDSAVPFEFTGVEQLVLHEGELAPLERPLRARGDSGLFAHKVVRYGMGGLLVSNRPDPDLPAPSRMFIPTPPAAGGALLSPEEWREQAGQYANDLAYEPELFARGDAYWAYEANSAASNLLTLFWRVRLREEDVDGAQCEWVPDEVMCVTQRDAQPPAQAGVAHELGITYGIEYWRRRRRVESS